MQRHFARAVLCAALSSAGGFAAAQDGSSVVRLHCEAENATYIFEIDYAAKRALAVTRNTWASWVSISETLISFRLDHRLGAVAGGGLVELEWSIDRVSGHAAVRQRDKGDSRWYGNWTARCKKVERQRAF